MTMRNFFVFNNFNTFNQIESSRFMEGTGLLDDRILSVGSSVCGNRPQPGFELRRSDHVTSEARGLLTQL